VCVLPAVDGSTDFSFTLPAFLRSSQQIPRASANQNIMDNGCDAPALSTEVQMSEGMRLSAQLDWVKIVGPSLAWANGTINEGRAVAILFKGADHLMALREAALNSPDGRLIIDVTVRQGHDSDTFVAVEYHGVVFADEDSGEDDDASAGDWHSIVACTGKRSCDVRWRRVTRHGVDEPKEQRHAIFASWLVSTFGAERLRHGAGIVDVAGGHGRLAAELHERTGAGVTVIDPLEDFERADGTQWDESSAVPPPAMLLRERFDAAFVERDATAAAPFLPGCSLICGMHPDQATEALVDAALALRRPFALVPCCTFNTLFPHRRRRNGDGVRVFSSFLDYLQEKDGRIERAVLPFEGRNTVLFWRGAEDETERACRCDEAVEPT
jgi:hypothetical protein